MEHSNLHYFGYIFVGFAHLTDKIFSDAEHKKVIELVNEWAEPDLNNGSFAIAMAEIMMWYEEIKDLHQKEIEFKKNVEYVGQQDWFKPQMRIKFIDHLIQLANADGIVKPEEKQYINLMAKSWGVEVSV